MSSKILIYGYCHEIGKLLSTFGNKIPDDVIQLCIRFYEITAIINIATGQCGNQLMTTFYQSLLKQSRTSDTYLRNGNTPRCISIDLDPKNNDLSEFKSVNMSPEQSCFRGEAEYSGWNWAKGFSTVGAEVIDDVMNMVRKEIESYDEPQAFQFMYNIGGGTGMLFLFAIYAQTSH